MRPGQWVSITICSAEYYGIGNIVPVAVCMPDDTSCRISKEITVDVNCRLGIIVSVVNIIRGILCEVIVDYIISFDIFWTSGRIIVDSNVIIKDIIFSD